MKKKITAIFLCVALLAVAIAGATLAYFTDKDAATNTFTIGNVKIDLIESYVHRGGETAYENVNDYPSSHDPATGMHTDEQILNASDKAYEDYLAAQQLMPGVAINKMPYVKNIGASDAYIRIRVMIPSALDLDVLNSSVYCSTALDKEEFTLADGFDWTNPPKSTVGDVEYDVYEFTRVKPLAAGKMTTWNVWNTIKMDTDVTQEDIEAMITAGAITADGQFNVLVQADAIQAASFTSAAEAFAAFDAQK